MEQILIPILTFLTTVCLGGAALLHYQGKLTLRRRLYQAAAGPAVEPTSPARDQLARLLHWLGTRASLKVSDRLVRELAQAGLFRPGVPAIYLGAKLMLLLIALLFFGLLQMTLELEPARGALLVLSGAGLAYFLPNLYVQARRNRHCTEVRHHLPDAIDLLEICVSSGMGMDMAWNLVAEEIRPVSPRLADEMALTNLEIHLGVLRADAMRHMTERTGADELGSLVAVMVQAERFGTSISEVLKVFASSMRELRSQRAEELAEKMAVKLLLPMIVFIFPAILVVAIGPAVMMIAQTLGTR